ncbi:MAG TPA: SRPBCC domain-containing protein [Opitutaceae bacterium]
MTKTIRQSVIIKAAPKKVFGALMNEKQHAKFTGSPASISKKVGGAFTCYGGYLTGYNLELISPKLIVQAWRSKGWPRGTYSIVTFALSGKAGGRTKISFTHAGVPSGDVKGKSEGWRVHYWKPLKAYLEG